MKSIIRNIALFAASILVSTGLASAQGSLLAAKIPFSFVVGSTTMPAGAYTLTTVFNRGSVVKIESLTGRDHVMAMSLVGDAPASPNNRLVFHHYGTQYFLSSIRCSGCSLNMKFARGKREEAARRQILQARLGAGAGAGSVTGEAAADEVSVAVY